MQAKILRRMRVLSSIQVNNGTMFCSCSIQFKLKLNGRIHIKHSQLNCAFIPEIISNSMITSSPQCQTIPFKNVFSGLIVTKPKIKKKPLASTEKRRIH